MSEDISAKCAAVFKTPVAETEDEDFGGRKEILIHFEKIESFTNPQLDCGSKAEVFGYACDHFVCGFCSENFNHLNTFLFHKSQHQLAEKTFKCELCNKTLISNDAVKRHYCDYHKIAMIFTRSDDQPRPEKLHEIETCPVSDSQGYNETMAVQSSNSVPELLENAAYNAPIQETSEEGNINGDIVLVNMDGSTEPVFQLEETNTAVPQPDEEVKNKGTEMEQSDATSKSSASQSPVMHSQSSHGKRSTENGGVETTPFLLITETSLENSRPFTTHWYCCIVCKDYKTRHRNGFVNHIETVHKNIPHDTEIPDPHPIEKYFCRDKVSLEKQLLTLSEYDATRPVVGSSKKRRLETQDVPGEYRCPVCSKVFTRLRYLRRHKVAHEKCEVAYACEECGKRWKSLALLERHTKKVHQKISKEYECKQCNFKSTVKKDIHNHRQIHTNGTSVLCDICGLAYSDNSTLKRHKGVHDLNRPFPCTKPGCNWRFKSEVMLNGHILSHETVGKFKCNICSKSFRHKHHLQRHAVSIHNVKAEAKRSYNSARSQMDVGIRSEPNIVHVGTEHLEFKIDDVALQGEQILLVSGDLGPIQNLIGIRDEVIMWPPGLQTE